MSDGVDIDVAHTPIVLRGLHRDGLATKLWHFFDANRDEELTRADIEAKFGMTGTTVTKALKELGDRGLVESVHVIRLPAKGRAA